MVKERKWTKTLMINLYVMKGNGVKLISNLKIQTKPHGKNSISVWLRNLSSWLRLSWGWVLFRGTSIRSRLWLGGIPWAVSISKDMKTQLRFTDKEMPETLNTSVLKQSKIQAKTSSSTTTRTQTKNQPTAAPPSWKIRLSNSNKIIRIQELLKLLKRQTWMTNLILSEIM